MTGWADVPVELLFKVASMGGLGLNGVCKSWRKGLETSCTKLCIDSSALPGDLVTRCPSLRHLDLSGCVWVPALAVQRLQSLQLTSLVVKMDGDRFSEAIISALCVLHVPQTNLVLELDDSRGPPANLSALRGLNLASLDLPGLNLKSFSLGAAKNFLQGLPFVKLDLASRMLSSSAHTEATASDLAILQGMPLAQLSLIHDKFITENGLEALGGLPLTDLELVGSTITHSGLCVLGGLGLPLKSLRIAFSFSEPAMVDNNGLAALHGLPLTHLHLDYCKYILEADGLEVLRGLPLESLILERIYGITDAGLDALRGMPLKALEVTFCPGIHDASLEILRELSLTSFYFFSEEELYGQNNHDRPKLTDVGLGYLRGMSLTSLDIADCSQITDLGLQYFRGMPLTKLALFSCVQITNAGLEFVQGMPLTDLDVSGSVNISDEGMHHLHGLLLTSLSLDHCGISGAGLQIISGLPLTTLSIKGCHAVSFYDLHWLRDMPLSELNTKGCTQISAGNIGSFWKDRYAKLQKKSESQEKLLRGLGIVE